MSYTVILRKLIIIENLHQLMKLILIGPIFKNWPKIIIYYFFD